MGKVIFDISMSLDGFITGANPHPEAGWGGLGQGGEQLHDWGFNSTNPRNLKIVESWTATGAVIVGRTTYNNSILNWGADGPTGAARVPTVIVSHSVPQDIPDGGVYTFVDSVEAALETAKKAAGDKDISITGANVAQQFLKLGLIDEVSVHLVPVLFGSGTRLFEGLDSAHAHISLETVEVIETPEVIHLRFRVAPRVSRTSADRRQDAPRSRRRVGRIGDRPADVGMDDMKDIGNGRGEPRDLELSVEEERADLGAIEEILEIAVRFAQLVDPVRKLVVDDKTPRIVAAQAVNRATGEMVEYRARRFVLAAGYAWTPHLLLLSSSSRFPNGLANRSGLVGRYMTGHAFVGAQIEMDLTLYPGMNEQHSLISRQFFRCRADASYLRHDYRIWESSAGREPRLRALSEA